ncbi:MAG TPA: DUF333 domain-containing protein [Candidatus Levybacteria bacterium]|nr:DUF333 domain-containing protein [Candidatus Levybacteria bacterium]
MKKITIIIICICIVIFTLPVVFSAHERNAASILVSAKAKLSQATWGKPQKTNEPTPYGDLNGVKLSGKLTTSQATLPHFEDAEALKKLGYIPDNSLSADGPGSSVWGYKKQNSEKTSIILYSYNTKPSSNNPNEPLQFNCPCSMTVSVFISNTINTNSNDSSAHQSSLPNPASVHCKKVGGTTVIQTLKNGAQYGLCQFEDNMACEEWALMRGECPVGGVKTTGYDTMGQKYCAWLGGQTLAIQNSTCTLPDGTVCSTENLYNGTCPES